MFANAIKEGLHRTTDEAELKFKNKVGVLNQVYRV